jgi:hypothetical protein
MENRCLAAALRACLVSLVMVVLIVVVHAFRHGWDSVNQPGDWIEKAVLFVVFALLYTVFLRNIERRSQK